ncbi:sterol desaturase family protein [Acinetobacter corruptisaponis]|uniref:Sterol desaturase family protein n=1 Tax=Acinetobacter corruptisaponis TaxID=3045147 RepID=A0ABY8S1T5_9GAMM|nr:sterol desaturase family protein [Acinetobacter sp. KCTC 92772]WHP04782.1 sterol desaturase family protein [Acinetobacter sp. KCTC 92772]
MLKGFVAGLVIANGYEWFAHKYLLHGVHRKGKPRFSPTPKQMESHWAHHREVRKQGFSDDCYVEGLDNWRTRNELMSLAVAAGVLSVVFYPFSKGMALAAIYSAGNYYYVHRRAHLEPDWAKRTIPWHYDHHMNSNQDANWCVTRPWFDYIMGTRVVSSADLKEANPLGLPLPQSVSRALGNAIESVFPAKWVEHKPKLVQPVVVEEEQTESEA